MGSKMFYERDVIVKDGVVSYGPPKVVELIPMTITPVPPRPRPDDPLVDPDYGIDIDEGYHPPHPPDEESPRVAAVLSYVDPQPDLPADAAPGSVWATAWYGKGTLPTGPFVVPPYASQNVRRQKK